jgi:glyoxylate reductase
MLKPRVFVSRNIPEAGLSLLSDKVFLEVWKGEIPPGKKILIEQAEKCEGFVVIPGDPVDREVLAAGRSLKIVSCYAVGFDSIDVEAATELGIMVTNTPDVLTEATADLAFGLLLSAARRIVEGDRLVRSGKWNQWGPRFMLGKDVSGSILGIVGMGRIGQAVARRAKAFGMGIVYHARHRNEVVEREIGARYLEFEALLALSDFVSVHCPLGPTTEGLIGERQLRAMKPSSILINTSRGRVVVEADLVRALQEGWIAGAGLDVFEKEPLPAEHPFFLLENVVVCPHLGSATIRTRDQMAVLAAENLLAALRGERPLHLVNPKVQKG